VEKDDLSLLANMTEKERKRLNSKGIFTVTQLSYTFRPRRRPKRLREKREKYHHALKALAIRQKKIHIVGQPQLKIPGTPVYLDVEGLPDRDFYYLIGIRFKTADSVVQRSLWADDAKGEKGIWIDFLNILAGIETPVLIHYGSFETTFFKRMKKRYGESLVGVGAAEAINSAQNLVSLLFGQVYFPTYSNRLKDLGAYLGFRWSNTNPSGIQSIIWRIDWEQSRNPLPKGNCSPTTRKTVMLWIFSPKHFCVFAVQMISQGCKMKLPQKLPSSTVQSRETAFGGNSLVRLWILRS
jgi:predicted RecB family nuclease